MRERLRFTTKLVSGTLIDVASRDRINRSGLNIDADRLTADVFTGMKA